ncbi:nodulation protein S (NodS) [Kribbella amoyensis]|uniref:Nodulation protein S (NodS) n=1 Tax=Kribbella amoyensis TaxID=996641 RepID=A0A561BMQ8_9ACTN|nr:SAM-dependent methyltransferase [Kribbella amoyensis]TWD80155.1 nodulation protein S (NodS) [Kribbella amoyensis]
MIDVIAVLRPEDVVVDFLSVLDPDRGRAAHLLIAGRGAYLELPAGGSLSGRLAAVAEFLHSSDDGVKPFSPETAADTITLETGGVSATVWTHNPADNRERRGRWGYELAGLIRQARVLHAVGDAPWFQWLTEADERLPPPLVEAKLDFVNTHAAALLALPADDEDALTTNRVPAVERFFAADTDQRTRMFAAMRGLGEDAALVSDPWDFATSPYERERLDATVSWVKRHLDPAAGRVIEVGACEGALTRRLLAEGFTVDATEPNQAFLTRLRETTGGDVRILPHSFEDLATTRRLTGSAYLLIELLYYEQELAMVGRFPTDRLFVSMEPDKLAAQTWPAGWIVEDQVDLVGPRLEPVANGRAYLRKRGSRGVLLRRR